VRRLAAAAAVLALALASCSSSGGDHRGASPTTTDRPTTTTSAPPTTTTIAADLTRRPPAPATPTEAATAFQGAEAVLHDAALADDDPRVARAGHVEQVAARALADHPQWDADVARLLPAADRAAAADDAAAGRDLRALVKTPKADLPAWTIVEPAPADELRRYYEEGERTFGVPWPYLAAVHLVETKMGRLRGTSTAGARGPMQFLPSTWKAYGGAGDIDSNHDAILGAARYLAANGGGRGDLHNALFHYNHSERYVRAVTRYAERIKADPRAYRGYWGWQVYYWSTLGDVWLRPGYTAAATRPVTAADLE
jgi:membrane-bound lytic murein transglycosylase B